MSKQVIEVIEDTGFWKTLPIQQEEYELQLENPVSPVTPITCIEKIDLIEIFKADWNAQ